MIASQRSRISVRLRRRLAAAAPCVVPGRSVSGRRSPTPLARRFEFPGTHVGNMGARMAPNAPLRELSFMGGPPMKPSRRSLAAGLIALATLLAGCGAGESGPAPSDVGGPFRLVDQSGARVDDHILRGKWTAVFFGYTFCPDVCPTTLTTLAQAIDRLGPDAKRFQVVFITIDPERDTPAQLRT